MPMMLPTRAPAKPAKQAARTPTLLDLSALSIGLVATALAGFVYFGTGDNIGATLILLLAAVVVLAMLRASGEVTSES